MGGHLGVTRLDNLTLDFREVWRKDFSPHHFAVMVRSLKIEYTCICSEIITR